MNTNFVVICLHSLDMRDFHSQLRKTPFLDKLRTRSVFTPMGRAQGHHQCDSLNAEMTGVWTARCSNSKFTERGFQSATKCWLPKTVIERLREGGYNLLTNIGLGEIGMAHRQPSWGTYAVEGGMKQFWLADEPQRLAQFNDPEAMTTEAWVERVRGAQQPFYAHLFVRTTHRPWGQREGLGALLGEGPVEDWPEDAAVARRAALERSDEFAALRRRGLAMADGIVEEIFEATRHIENVTYVVYSNHGEVLDHFRYHHDYTTDECGIVGTSHGNFPYEVLYANMQMWLIPGQTPRVMTGISRSIDFAPTILELAKVKTEPLDGTSMLPDFQRGKFPPRERFAETIIGDGALGMVRPDGMKVLSTGERAAPSGGKLYGPEHHRLAVFDLTADPYEYSDLAHTAAGDEAIRWALATHAAMKSAR